MDTSGEIDVPVSAHSVEVTRWTGLDAFTQGYIEAALQELQRSVDAKRYGLWKRVGFADLAPETLAAILKDCEAIQFVYTVVDDRPSDDVARKAGAAVWDARQRGQYAAFPRLTAYLGHDGKVYLRDLAA